MSRRSSILNSYNKESFQELVSSCKSKGDLVNALQLSVSGSSYNIIDEFVKMWDINVSSLKGRAWNRGLSLPKKHSTSDLLENKAFMHTAGLKNRLLKEGILKNECSMCGVSCEWNGKSLTLHLDHIDGNRFNNYLSNLRILCPNCHSQTDTYCSRNRGS